MRNLFLRLSRKLPLKFRNILKKLAWAYTDWVSFNSYSGEGEDMILRKIFYKKEKGFYVDVGAYHPKKSSNTYFFYKRGWSGINIDAMPGSMKLFNRLRKRDINLEIPLGKKGETVKYYEFEDKALNRFESPKLQKKDSSKSHNRLIKIHQLQSDSLNSILGKHLPQNQKIDFLSIDVEGQEFWILESFDFEKYQPDWILTEIWNYSMESQSNGKVDSLLKEKGYRPTAKTLNTVFYQLKA
ncbi:FkbM family methyltransferase [uncultured Algoriphagus sp.]|uniref:FkbM family methyltransferase n=1 Tax=uncultured Algoriphagus sp. TaxID=417365 RepID=UPI002596FDEF|nr:FkbM family methyltransferase [uncultured Algoriphagus sp.]